jgi:hypothetical protein
MAKSTLFRFLWEKSLKRTFKQCAKDRRRVPSDLARQIIEQWMACSLTAEERAATGLPEFALTEPHLLMEAVQRWHQQAPSLASSQSYSTAVPLTERRPRK